MDLFGSSPSQPAPPILIPPTVMPVPDDKGAKAAVRKKSALRANRGQTRDATIFTQGEQTDTLA